MWGFQTNVRAVFEKILKYHTDKKWEIPQRLTILSDMEFSDLAIPDMTRRLKREKAKTSDHLVCSLQWNTLDDLDIWCKTPSGSKIYYGNRTADGGHLDVDMNAGQSSREPVENIYWKKKPVHGQYVFSVNLFSYKQKQHGETIPYRITYRIGNLVKHVDGLVGGTHGRTVDLHVLNWKGPDKAYWGKVPSKLKKKDNPIEDYTATYRT
eukprot:UN30937